MLYGVVLPMLGNMCEASVQLYTLGLEETRNAPDSRDRVVVRSASALCSPFCQRHCSC
jgi:hypothetical protein